MNDVRTALCISIFVGFTLSGLSVIVAMVFCGETHIFAVALVCTCNV